jgi:CO/xanthine dehydrogenase Mo-binding subunit
MAVVPKFVGERVRRREDPRLITGAATYVDDLKLGNAVGRYAPQPARPREAQFDLC